MAPSPSGSSPTFRIVTELSALPAAQWDALRGPDRNPFLSHTFLSLLERHGCVGETWGWLPRHVVVEEKGQLIGALPLYLKFNSYGELVFDWSWAEAYQRAGLRYYPKLVAAVPYSPVTGPRLLVHPQADHARVGRLLLDAAQALQEESRASSLHILFPDERDAALLDGAGYLPRIDCQFHWHRRGFRDFSDFLDSFTAEKRKKLKRERRRVQEQGVRLEVRHGHELSEAEWHRWHRFYADTFDRRGGYPTLTAGFFAELGERLREQVVVVLAFHQRELVAAAFSLRSADTLYGRHWGCAGEYHSLHFEACYYSGIDYCLAQGIDRFEPGAQGEHKVGRGFEPVITRSAHRLAEPRFQQAISDYLARERAAIRDHMQELNEHLPFKQAHGGGGE